MTVRVEEVEKRGELTVVVFSFPDRPDPVSWWRRLRGHKPQRRPRSKQRYVTETGLTWYAYPLLSQDVSVYSLESLIFENELATAYRRWGIAEKLALAAAFKAAAKP